MFPHAFCQENLLRYERHLSGSPSKWILSTKFCWAIEKVTSLLPTVNALHVPFSISDFHLTPKPFTRRSSFVWHATSCFANISSPRMAPLILWIILEQMFETPVIASRLKTENVLHSPAKCPTNFPKGRLIASTFPKSSAVKSAPAPATLSPFLLI